MTFQPEQIRIDNDRLVIQAAHNQLLLCALDNIEQTKTITVPTSIESIILNSKLDVLAVLLVDKQWHFYRLGSGVKLELRHQIAARNFHISVLYLDALWLGQLYLEDPQPKLTFFVQQLMENVHYECSVEFHCQFTSLQLSQFIFRSDQLSCIFSNETNSTLFRFRLSSHLIEQIYSRDFEKTLITKLAVNNKNLLFLVTSDNVVHCIDTDLTVKWIIKPRLEVLSILFDVNVPGLFCLVTDRVMFFAYYLPTDHEIVVLEEVTNKGSISPVAFKAPGVFTVSGKTVSVQKLLPLEYLSSDQQIIVNMFGYDRKQFVKHLHQSNFTESTLWMSMIKRCVKQAELEAAVYCAAKMGDARLARDLRREMALGDPTSACALLALNMQLCEVAEQLLGPDHTDTHSAICQLQNKWNEAFLHSDKITIKSVYYNYARFLEEDNKINDAIKYYELSGNVLEVPRMLFETGNISQLEEYCLKSDKNDKISSSLVTWWGQYCESQGDHKTAIEIYGNVSDYYNLVRLMCHVGQAEKAIHIVNQQLDSNHTDTSGAITAAVLYLGKHLESVNSVESVHYYLRCGAIRHATRVCIANDHYDELVTIAVQHCDPNEAKHLLDNYCEANAHLLANQSNLVKLYYKCRLVDQAIRTAVTGHLWTELRQICQSELDQDSRNFVVSDELLALVMQALKSDTSLIDIVIDLIIMSKEDNFQMIPNTIQEFGIDLDDHLMGRLESYIVDKGNTSLVNTFAELCLEKGNYQLAAKLYNKTGNRIDSLKALIRSGNVDKVIHFANVARDKTVFKMTANFLQTINHQDRSLIIKFYTKAEAFQELDRFKSDIELS